MSESRLLNLASNNTHIYVAVELIEGVVVFCYATAGDWGKLPRLQLGKGVTERFNLNLIG